MVTGFFLIGLKLSLIEVSHWMLGFPLMLAENFLTNSVENTPFSLLSSVSHYQFQTLELKRQSDLEMCLISPVLCLPVCCLPTFPTLPLCKKRAGIQLKLLETSSGRGRKGNWLPSFGVFFHIHHRQIQKNTPSADTLVILSKIFRC